MASALVLPSCGYSDPVTTTPQSCVAATTTIAAVDGAAMTSSGPGRRTPLVRGAWGSGPGCC